MKFFIDSADLQEIQQAHVCVRSRPRYQTRDQCGQDRTGAAACRARRVGSTGPRPGRC